MRDSVVQPSACHPRCSLPTFLSLSLSLCLSLSLLHLPFPLPFIPLLFALHNQPYCCTTIPDLTTSSLRPPSATSPPLPTYPTYLRRCRLPRPRVLVYPSRSGVRYGQTITCSTLVIGMPGKKPLSTCRLPRKTLRKTLVTIHGRLLPWRKLRVSESFQGIEITFHWMNEQILGRFFYIFYSLQSLDLSLFPRSPLFFFPSSLMSCANEVFSCRLFSRFLP